MVLQRWALRVRASCQLALTLQPRWRWRWRLHWQQLQLLVLHLQPMLLPLGQPCCFVLRLGTACRLQPAGSTVRPMIWTSVLLNSGELLSDTINS